jgi:hypothetical protein
MQAIALNNTTQLAAIAEAKSLQDTRHVMRSADSLTWHAWWGSMYIQNYTEQRVVPAAASGHQNNQ